MVPSGWGSGGLKYLGLELPSCEVVLHLMHLKATITILFLYYLTFNLRYKLSVFVKQYY